jgi:hypothetical protein
MAQKGCASIDGGRRASLHPSAFVRSVTWITAMLIVVEATDAHGNAITTEPLTRLRAAVKLWEFKTSGCSGIRAFDAATGAPIDLLQKSDDEPAA